MKQKKKKTKAKGFFKKKREGGATGDLLMVKSFGTNKTKLKQANL